MLVTGYLSEISISSQSSTRSFNQNYVWLERMETDGLSWKGVPQFFYRRHLDDVKPAHYQSAQQNDTNTATDTQWQWKIPEQD